MEHVAFKDFLIKKKQEDEGKKVNWEDRKDSWLDSINTLYQDINKWLSPFIAEGLISINQEKTIFITEEYIGRYATNRLDIYLGNDIISMIPKGTLIVGSYGRIDMIGSKGEIMLIEPILGNWKFAKRTPKLETWDVTEDSFKEILQDLV